MDQANASNPALVRANPLVGDVGWPQRAMSVAKIVVYSCDVTTGLALRSENSMEILGIAPSGPTLQWSDRISSEDRPYFENAVKSITPQAARFEVEYRF